MAILEESLKSLEAELVDAGAAMSEASKLRAAESDEYAKASPDYTASAYAAAAALQESIQAQATREVAQLSAQLQGVDRTLSADRIAWAEEPKQAEQQVENCAKLKSQYGQDLDGGSAR